MNNNPSTPLLTGNSGIDLRKKVKTLFILSCPKCNTDLDVTNISFGTHVQCPNCENVTYSPEYKPPWWSKTKIFLLTLFITFILGIASSLIASWIYDDQYKEVSERKKSEINQQIADRKSLNKN